MINLECRALCKFTLMLFMKVFYVEKKRFIEKKLQTTKSMQKYTAIFIVDVNECKGFAKDVCGEHGRCVNTSPGWFCNCDQGFYNNTTSNNLQTCEGKS